ncbi:putative pentatricopeptide repeat-containing protein [Iris pallida]|uniref:Pentatricopeptide repeat-containing protein n=1 Tax=Iris pallida TaxID=29817 RepID=A0AAX6FHY1_IRIPA|nr:putative pentatricopeptide repeat-containing protein [Iris pallida]
MSISFLSFDASHKILESFIAYSLNTLALKSLKFLEANSKLAVFLCFFHISPSALNIPSPRRTSMYDRYSSPFVASRQTRSEISITCKNRPRIGKFFYLGVVCEVGLEDMLHIRRVCNVGVGCEGHSDSYRLRL